MLYCVPDDVRPTLQRMAIEVLCWGVRNLKKFQLLPVTSPSAELEIGGIISQTDVIANTRRGLNFERPFIFFDVVCLELCVCKIVCLFCSQT